MSEHRRPRSLPDGLIVELSRCEVLPGRSAEADAWMAMLDDRYEECVATLDRERMAVEVVFRLQEEGRPDQLFWFAIRGAGGAGLDTSPYVIDADHVAMATQVKAPGWTEAQVRAVFLPAPVQAAILAWAVRPGADADQT